MSIGKAVLVDNYTGQKEAISAAAFIARLKKLKVGTDRKSWSEFYTLYGMGSQRELTVAVPKARLGGYQRRPKPPYFRRLPNGQKVTTEFLKNKRFSKPLTLFDRFKKTNITILANLDLDLMHNQRNPKTSLSFKAWKDGQSCGLFRTVSVKSIGELSKLTKKLRSLDPQNYKNRIVISHRGYVQSYNDFYMRAKDRHRSDSRRLVDVFKKTYQGTEGADYKTDDTVKKRITPPKLRLFQPERFKAFANGKHRIQGNRLSDERDPWGAATYIDHLVFTQKDYALTKSFQKLVKLLEKDAVDYCVILASSYMNVDPDGSYDALKCKFNKIVINDIDKQMMIFEKPVKYAQAVIPFPVLDDTPSLAS